MQCVQAGGGALRREAVYRVAPRPGKGASGGLQHPGQPGGAGLAPPGAVLGCSLAAARSTCPQPSCGTCSPGDASCRPPPFSKGGPMPGGWIHPPPPSPASGEGTFPLQVSLTLLPKPIAQAVSRHLTEVEWHWERGASAFPRLSALLSPYPWSLHHAYPAPFIYFFPKNHSWLRTSSSSSPLTPKHAPGAAGYIPTLSGAFAYPSGFHDPREGSTPSPPPSTLRSSPSLCA